MELVERQDALEALERAHDAARAGEGRFLLLCGEAGIGKTSILRQFAQDRSQAGPTAWGWCDPIDAPRPLSPFHDVLNTLRGVPPLREQEDPQAFLALLRDAVETSPRPVLVIVEDIHWADEASLELLRLIGRRAHLLPLLLVASYRDDEVGPVHPLRRLLGTLATVEAGSRVTLAPLSPEGVHRLAAGTLVEAEALHRRTGGNPFFVTELLGNAAVGEGFGAVSDLVLERMGRLSPSARALLETAAVMGRVEVSVLRRMSVGASVALEACVAAGLLRGDSLMVGFRHELVRQVVLEALVPTRHADLHADVLRALTEAGSRSPHAWRIMPKGRAMQQRSGSMRWRLPGMRPPPVPTAKRPFSSPAPCDSRRRKRRQNAATC
ncbi:ATP-binding protein [Roseinatronobacter monicus]|uniref:AAA ATPase-like protein n=1 Tax=Roseinatronobacter monicus TaxID=393481 RepID=A0A543K4C0_9RHOB|nr:AAA family ATPase [Roseinatronobacter monicus]TQM89874.1 AAA ATPase-like protein [Roseinatronobacter monicus]